jgi:RNA polymerase sigma-70 factor (ECF subfamily)
MLSTLVSSAPGFDGPGSDDSGHRPNPAGLCQAGNGLAHDIAACRSALLRAASQLVGVCDADDLVQNTIERALCHQSGFQAGSNLLAWLRRIMSNQFVDTWRKQIRRATLPLDQDLPAPDEEPAPPWSVLSGADLRHAIAALKPSFRAVFELYAEGLPYQEIARRLDLPLGTVGTRLLRARAFLRKLLLRRLAAGPGSVVSFRCVPPPTNDDGA